MPSRSAEIRIPRAWLGIELRHFAALEAVSEERSFQRAASRLGYSQPAISQQIAALERAVGARLIDRSPGSRHGSLTPAGKVVLEHSVEILRRMRAAEIDLDRLISNSSALLRVGAYQSAAAHLLPEALTRFAATHQDVRVELTHATEDNDLLRLLEVGELDLTYATSPLPDGPFEAIPLLRDDYVVVARRNGTPRAGRALTLAELAQLPLIAFRSCRHMRAVEGALEAGGIRLNFVLRSDDSATVRELVAAGDGVGLIPRLSFEQDERLTATPAPPEIPPRATVIAANSERLRSTASRDFVEAAQEAAGRQT